MNEYDSIILSYYDSLIHQSDLELLKEGQWLNDRIIGFVYEYFEIEIFNAECSDYLFSFLNPSTVQYLKLSNSIEEAKMCFLEPLELNRKDYLFLPLNNNRTTEAGGCHWSLMVIDKKRSILKHCDSIGSNENEALSFFEKYKTHFGLEKFETEINFPKQTNSVDCGAYVLAATELIGDELKSNSGKELLDINYKRINPKYVSDLRKKYHNLILLLSSQ